MTDAASSAGRTRGDRRFESRRAIADSHAADEHGGLNNDRPHTFIAAPQPVVRMLGTALAANAMVSGSDTWDRCVDWLDKNDPSLVLVCYAFDEMRPFRLIAHIRDDARHEGLPIVLVRALPVPLRGTQEEEIRESYKTLGITEFINLRRLIEEHGQEPALEDFRARMIHLLR